MSPRCSRILSRVKLSQVKEKRRILRHLRQKDLFVLDNSLCESTLGQIVGHAYVRIHLYTTCARSLSGLGFTVQDLGFMRLRV